jgi:hypothetical protein
MILDHLGVEFIPPKESKGRLELKRHIKEGKE